MPTLPSVQHERRHCESYLSDSDLTACLSLSISLTHAHTFSYPPFSEVSSSGDKVTGPIILEGSRTTSAPSMWSISKSSVSRPLVIAYEACTTPSPKIQTACPTSTRSSSLFLLPLTDRCLSGFAKLCPACRADPLPPSGVALVRDLVLREVQEEGPLPPPSP
jgi:hypothetical protein